ncbi:unnamed protein product [Closterium sp. NIES-54]
MVHVVLACVLGTEQHIVQTHRKKERERDLETIGVFSGGGADAATGCDAATTGSGVGGVGKAGAGGVLGVDRSRGKGGGVGGAGSAVVVEEEAAKNNGICMHALCWMSQTVCRRGCGTLLKCITIRLGFSLPILLVCKCLFFCPSSPTASLSSSLLSTIPSFPLPYSHSQHPNYSC